MDLGTGDTIRKHHPRLMKLVQKNREQQGPEPWNEAPV
jgi:hypothetical protein